MCEHDGEPFHESLSVAFKSALTKFDSLSAYFAGGVSVQEVIAMLLDEMRQDQDFAHLLGNDLRHKEFVKFVSQSIGKIYGAWKRGTLSDKPVDKPSNKPADVDNVLSWPSIENYPEWVFEQINIYCSATPEEKAFARMELEQTLLETPLWSVSTKYDGTCFGKLDTGEFVGRRHFVGQSDTYLNTSTAAANECDASALKEELSRILGVELERRSVCVWGELMCNPGYYDYLARGLFEQWLPFGVVLKVPKASEADKIIQRLQDEGLAYSPGLNGKFRLSMCAALRRLLQDVARCHVVEEVLQQATHAEVVAQGAKDLMEGRNEGVVLAFRRVQGQASLRKWKNSSEGQGASKKHAQRLQQLNVISLAKDGHLDVRIADMVDMMIAVAEAGTQPMKTGRKALKK
ncbi:unnamed protein product [Durusdinium trenchii]|uniref:Uncharacterized protein n=1 Tax=Durusdinium trenchii TaxID=1381693 RepID=A0ABP0MW97_9DINO